ncbi:MAG TPA: FtsX-like permease family protein [Tissierellia bacterium]|nr:FtsX-like permease family protein [Tissierellia bacterium]
MKVLSKKFFRQIRQAKLQFFALVAIVAIGTFFSTGLTAISGSLSSYIEPYYQEYNLSDAIVYFDALPAEAVQSFLQIEGVKRAEVRQVLEMSVSQSEHSAKLLVHTIPLHNEINRSALVEGREPGAGEVLIDSFFAEANQLKVGDTIQLVHQKSEWNLMISGLCENVEHSFNIEDASMVLPDRETFGVAYLAEESLGQAVYNQLLIELEAGFALSDVLPQIEATAVKYPYQYVIPKESMSSYQAIRTTIDNNKVLSFVVPLILFTISSIIILISLSRLVDSQRSQIGIMKALGVSRKTILYHYMLYPITSTFFGSGAGLGLAYFLFVPMLDDIGRRTYSLPGYQVSLSLHSVFLPLLISLLFGCIACYISTRRILKQNTMELMKPKSVKSAHRLALEKVPQLWSRLNFTYKLLLRDMSINKWKLLAGSLGVMACVILMVTALGFRASMQQMMQRTKDMYSYDLLIHSEAELVEEVLQDQVAEISFLTKLNLQLTDYEKTRFEFLVLDPSTSHFRHFDEDHHSVVLRDDGLILPQSFAKRHDISPGQEIRAVLIQEDGTAQELRLHVAQLSAQYTAPKIFASQEYLRKSIGEIAPNGMTVRIIQGDIASIKEELLDRPEALSVSTSEDVQLRISNLIKQNNPVFSIFILVAIVLSFGAIYTVSTINIQEQMRDLAIMKVLGYSRKEIYRLLFNQNFLITTIAIFCALPFCVLSYGQVVDALRASGQMIPDQLHGLTFIGGAGITVLITVITNQLLKLPIRQIDMAESIKQFE